MNKITYLTIAFAHGAYLSYVGFPFYTVEYWVIVALTFSLVVGRP